MVCRKRRLPLATAAFVSFLPMRRRKPALQLSKVDYTVVGSISSSPLGKWSHLAVRFQTIDLFQVKEADTVWKGFHENDDEEDDDGSLHGFIVADDNIE